MANDLKIRIHSDDPKLKRHIDHDSRSGLYRYPTDGLDVVDVEHAIHIAGLNQGNVGKCTAESATEVLASDPFWSSLPAGVETQLGDTWSNGFYSDEETLDGDGPYPPNDNGSSGLTSAKVAKNRGLISGYQHTFTALDALKAVGQVPGCLGMQWKTGCDAVDTDTGQIRYTGTTRGGHELSVYKIVVASEQVWLRQHWGPWGYHNLGVCWLSFEDFEAALASSQQGDMTFYVPLTQPAPTPTPQPTPSGVQVNLAAADAAILDQWAAARHTSSNARAAAAWNRGTSGASLEARKPARRFHDAGTGHYVSEQFAADNPTTTFGSNE